MISRSTPESAIQKEIALLERKLKQMGAMMGHRPDIPPEIHLAFLRRVYAFEMNEREARGKAQDEEDLLN